MSLEIATLSHKRCLTICVVREYGFLMTPESLIVLSCTEHHSHAAMLVNLGHVLGSSFSEKIFLVRLWSWICNQQRSGNVFDVQDLATAPSRYSVPYRFLFESTRWVQCHSTVKQYKMAYHRIQWRPRKPKLFNITQSMNWRNYDQTIKTV